jgi:hypothetical protein
MSLKQRVQLGSPRVLSIPVNSNLTAHGAHTKLGLAEACAVAVIVKLKSGNWCVQVRRKGKYASRTFLRKCDAEQWAIQSSRDIDQGKSPARRIRTKAIIFGDLIDLHIKDMHDVGKRPRRSYWRATNWQMPSARSSDTS